MVTTATTKLITAADYLAEPVKVSDRQGPWPGIVVVHDAFGAGNDMKEQSDWLAAAGYLTLMPDLYEGKSTIRCLQGAFRQLVAQTGPIFEQIEQARVALGAHPNCTGTVGVIGFCMGGGFALLLAGRPGWAAASVNYGQLPKDLDGVLSAPCPVVASFGGKDKSLPGAAEKLQASLEKSGVAHDIKEYPQARHGFMNRLTVASPLTPLLKVMGVGYDHEAAADAKNRILEFFDTHLRQTAVPAQP